MHTRASFCTCLAPLKPIAPQALWNSMCAEGAKCVLTLITCLLIFTISDSEKKGSNRHMLRMRDSMFFPDPAGRIKIIMRFEISPTGADPCHLHWCDKDHQQIVFYRAKTTRRSGLI